MGSTQAVHLLDLTFTQLSKGQESAKLDLETVCSLLWRLCRRMASIFVSILNAIQPLYEIRSGAAVVQLLFQSVVVNEEL